MAEATLPDTDQPTASGLGADVKVEDAGPSRKKLSVVVPAASVEARVAESLSAAQADIELPGFRRGKAPLKLVEKRFGEHVRREAMGQILGAAYSEAVEQNKLQVLGEPTMDDVGDLRIEPGKDLAFSFEIEVLPEFDLPPLEGVEIKRPTFEVTGELVDKELEKLCINEGELEEQTEPAPGDYLSGRGIMKGPDGEEYYDIDGAVVRVPLPEDNGAGMILGVKVDDFETQLGRPKPGETATVTATGPEQHEKEELRGKPLTITFTVSRVDRIIPAGADQVAERYGLENVDAVKELIRTRLNQRVLIQQQVALRQQVAKHLVDTVDMTLPERLTAKQAQRAVERRRLELMHRGVDEQRIEQHIAEFRNASADIAGRELKLQFVLHAAGKELGVQVSDAEINGRIAQIAVSRGQRPEELRSHLIQTRQVNGIVQQVHDHKVLDAIISKATIEDVSAEEFRKLFGSADETGTEPEAV